ncbi:GMC family oxidoreductase [Chitinimonas sp. BJB300]|uniref:GMC family oxidoreductase n=1 Tax=Chitinimonas sp. BJB300 TaxID=1559339 RepID=UPI000C0C8BFC|nr:GMC family oxidoreductase [Chitinimonas sp. BJB300]PHV12916.1 GMC family oxidoreductase [Chitinimonas sp. BJB300]TSJ88485.1 GMC family oxidoreductase [Chitinimonas sp. BJB300]
MPKDLIAEGLASGKWDVRDASSFLQDQTVEADVVIVGTGAGGGVAAEILSLAGLKVVMVEEGGLNYASKHFHLREAEAYPQLYQESAGRQTKDKAITILQGRTTGGSTVVNWTSSFRTPPTTLHHWRTRFGLEDMTVEGLAPWFGHAEKRLNIRDWLVEPNANNKALALGAERIGIHWAKMRRNVNGCLNLGYCGMGCPVNAKQSMLVTTIPSALNQGATLFIHSRAERVLLEGDRAAGIECVAMDASGRYSIGTRLTVQARTVVLAGGAINTPALMLRSKLPDPFGLIGKRTFLHPVNISGAIMPSKVEGWQGAPQSIYSDHYLDTMPVDGPIGYKLEVPPLHPVLTGITMSGFGEKHRNLMACFDKLQVVLALLRDGFNEGSQGGTVGLKSDGTPLLDYPISSYVWAGVREAYLTMAELQFAAGATHVMPIHEDVAAEGYASWAKARSAILALPLVALRARMVSAHVMGGAGMSVRANEGVVNSEGRFHHANGLYVMDGSVFPTSIGANPQLSIYGLVSRNASLLAKALTGRTVVWPVASSV